MKTIFILNFIFITSFISRALGEIFAECENLEDGTFITGTQGCKSYIYCEGEESYEGFCPTQLLFNPKDGSCAPESEVDCSDTEVPEVEPTEAETQLPPRTSTPKPTTTTKATITTIAPVPTNEDVNPLGNEPTQVPGTEVYDKTTQGSVTAYPSENTNIVSTPSSNQICPAYDDQNSVILLPSESSCSEYFICYHGTPVRMACSGQLLFDYVTLKCELPIRAQCKVSIQTTASPKSQCVRNTYDFYPYPKNCNYYYKCINGFLSLQQCPIGFGWSEEMKLCLKLDGGRCPDRLNIQLQNQSWLNNFFSVQ